ncbi:MAG: MFS transporter [Actinomycetia bacterium]|nr:MFS transporter [Actinomycetes bacterium]MCP3910816.1 MFS transporter [Actinomycetes bacterium]MCP4087073.1 MFS transporter [Actinomycetes bacterium]
MTRRELLPYFLLVSVAMMGMGGIFTLLGKLRDDLGFSETGLGVMVASGFFVAFGAQVGLARFSDRGHAAAMIRIGLACMALAMLAMAVATELWQFIAARGLLGLGIGSMLPAVRRIVIAADPQRVGANMGTMGAFDLAGFFIGPLIAAGLAEVAGLRAPFLALALITAVFIPSVARLPLDPGATTTTERRVLRVLLADKGVRAMLISAAGWFAMIGAFESVWAVMLTDQGAPTWVIGVTMSIILLPMMIIAPLSGPWAQRLGPLRTAGAGVLLSAPCVLAFGFISPLWAFIAVAAVQGLADAIVFPSTQVGVALAADKELAASAQGLQGASLELTAGTVALFAGGIYENYGRSWLFTGITVMMIVGVATAAHLARSLPAEDVLLVGDRPQPVAA